MKAKILNISFATLACAFAFSANSGNDNVKLNNNQIDSANYQVINDDLQSDYNNDILVRNGIVERLNNYGLNETNRPHLFSIIESQYVNKKDNKSNNNTTTKALVNSASDIDCESKNNNLNNKKVCSFFTFSDLTVATSNETGEKYVSMTAYNSETDPINYTFIDLSLVNEKGETLSVSKYKEYFFDDDTNKKRKYIHTIAELDWFLNALISSDEVFAKAYVIISYYDQNDIEVVEVADMKIVLSRDTFLLRLGLDVNGEPINRPSPKLFSSILSSSTPPSINTDGIFFDVEHPKDTKSINGDQPDGKIAVCLNRDHNDCDYPQLVPSNVPNAQAKIRIPFKGEMIVSGKVIGVYRTDGTIKEFIETDDGFTTKITNLPNREMPYGLRYGSDIFIQSKEVGGAFKLSGDDYLTPSSKNLFSESIQIEYFDNERKTRISWDIPRNYGDFGSAINFSRFEDSNWIMNIAVSVQRILQNGIRLPARAQNYNIGTTYIPPSEMRTFNKLDLKPMQFEYSCLAKGSLILLPDGTEVPIETLSKGDKVLGASQYTPNKTKAMVIEDISIGVETIPMIELKTMSGKTLLLTESHPVINQSGQAIWSSDVTVGMPIYTKNGKEIVISRTDKYYDDHVYNLRLGRLSTDGIDREGENFSMFANGIQVGDLAMQTANEFKHIEETEQDILNRLPKVWHNDYLNSQL